MAGEDHVKRKWGKKTGSELGEGQDMKGIGHILRTWTFFSKSNGKPLKNLMNVCFCFNFRKITMTALWKMK